MVKKLTVIEVQALQKEQQPILINIANELISSIPETWDAANLQVENISLGDGGIKQRIAVISPENKKDFVMPTEALYSDIRSLATIYEKYGSPWNKLLFQVSLTPEGDWDFKSSFEYLEAAQ